MQEVAKRITRSSSRTSNRRCRSPGAGHAGASDPGIEPVARPGILSGRSCATASLHCFESVPAEVSARRHHVQMQPEAGEGHDSTQNLPIGILGLSLIAAGANAQEPSRSAYPAADTDQWPITARRRQRSSLALDEIIRQSRRARQKVELVIEDGQCRPANSVNRRKNYSARQGGRDLRAFCSHRHWL